jgi:hypothetical protein
LGATRVLHPLDGAQSPPSVKQALDGIKIGQEAAQAHHVIEGTDTIVYDDTR